MLMKPRATQRLALAEVVLRAYLMTRLVTRRLRVWIKIFPARLSKTVLKYDGLSITVLTYDGSTMKMWASMYLLYRRREFGFFWRVGQMEETCPNLRDVFPDNPNKNITVRSLNRF